VGVQEATVISDILRPAYVVLIIIVIATAAVGSSRRLVCVGHCVLLLHGSNGVLLHEAKIKLLILACHIILIPYAWGA
jgi:hypothetical protein